MASTLYFNVGDPVWFYDIADPNPAPGVVTAVNGENDFDVEVFGETRTEKHVGAQIPAIDPDPSPSVRWIELREAASYA